jgi:hypothetical protein
MDDVLYEDFVGVLGLNDEVVHVEVLEQPKSSKFR